MSIFRNVKIITAWVLFGVGAFVAMFSAVIGEYNTAWWAGAFALIGALMWRVTLLETMIDLHDATIADLAVKVAALRRQSAGADAITDLMISNLVEADERSR